MRLVSGDSFADFLRALAQVSAPTLVGRTYYGRHRSPGAQARKRRIRALRLGRV